MDVLIRFPAQAEPPQPEPSQPPTGTDPESSPEPDNLPAAEGIPLNPQTSWWPRLSPWVKGAQAVLLTVAVCFMTGATINSSSRLNDLSHRLMCQCGCAQLLGECDHVGCPSREKELDDLRGDLGAGMSDQQIFDAFVVKYGAVVLAAPRTQGFELVAWIAPFAVFAAALLGTILLIRRWGGLRGFEPQPADPVDATTLDPAERERRERVHRETGLED